MIRNNNKNAKMGKSKAQPYTKKGKGKNNPQFDKRSAYQDPVGFTPVYRGRIHLPQGFNQDIPIKMNQALQVAATTSGAGVIDLVFGNSPASLSDWTALSGMYNEYRCLGLELRYVPIKQVASWAYGIAHTVVDHDVSSALGGINAALQHESCKMYTMYSEWNRDAKASGVEEFDWIPVTAPVSNFYIKVYSSDNATIQTIGRFYLTYLLEFRGKN